MNLIYILFLYIWFCKIGWVYFIFEALLKKFGLVHVYFVLYISIIHCFWQTQCTVIWDILVAKLPFLENQLVRKWFMQEKKKDEKLACCQQLTFSMPKIFTCKGSEYQVIFQVNLTKHQYLTIYAGNISLAFYEVGRDNNRLRQANITWAIGK